MSTKRKPTYEQALGLQKGHDTARANRKRRNAQTTEQTPEEKAKWDADRKTALAAYRSKKAAK